jgi:hypothetical protein
VSDTSALIADWLTAIGVVIIAAAAVAWLLPSSLWLQVNSVNVSNSTVGVPPAMVVDQVISRPFLADWTVTVMKKNQNGFYSSCSAHGQTDYSPDSTLPKNLTLDLWTWPDKCPLDAGTYYIRTLWDLRVLGGLTKEERVTSNIFQVTAKEGN